MRYLETMYLLDIKDIWNYLEQELPAFASEFFYQNLELDYICDVMIYSGLQQVAKHITGRDVIERTYDHDLLRIADQQLSDVKWYVARNLFNTLTHHHVSLDKAIRIKYIASRTALVIVVIRGY